MDLGKMGAQYPPPPPPPQISSTSIKKHIYGIFDNTCTGDTRMRPSKSPTPIILMRDRLKQSFITIIRQLSIRQLSMCCFVKSNFIFTHRTAQSYLCCCLSRDPQIAKRCWPTVFATGNHAEKTPDTWCVKLEHSSHMWLRQI